MSKSKSEGAEMKCRICLCGCDDNTEWEQEVSEAEFNFLEKLSEKSKEISTYCCMPQIS